MNSRGFDDHSLRAPFGVGLPPPGRVVHLAGVVEVDGAVLRGGEDGVVPRQPGGDFHVPRMGLVAVHFSFAGQEMERSQGEVFDGVYRPAIVRR